MGSEYKQDPVVLIGMPKSGTTVVFECLAAHEKLGWFSNYSAKFPRFPAANLVARMVDNSLIYVRGRKAQRQELGLINKILPRPMETYTVWQHACDRDFTRSYLVGESATQTEQQRIHSLVEKTLKYQGKQRFIVKLTGPPRIRFLTSLFPNAIFIHVIRNCLDVVNSLLTSDFWAENGGLTNPYWHGGLESEDLDLWEREGRSPVLLCALQWRRVIEVARDEAKRLTPGRYTEVKYEDFIAQPKTVVSGLLERIGLDHSSRVVRYIETANVEEHIPRSNEINQKTLELIEKHSGSYLKELGYSVSRN